jgi:hypothetical protein
LVLACSAYYSSALPKYETNCEVGDEKMKIASLKKKFSRQKLDRYLESKELAFLLAEFSQGENMKGFI